MIDDDLYFIRTADNAARGGAAADGADSEEALAALPRILRYAFLTLDRDVRDRIVAEIVEAWPALSADAARWASTDEMTGWAPLAAALDAAAVSGDLPTLRSLADSVRLVSMRTSEAVRDRPTALRILAALREGLAAATTRRHVPSSICASVERMILGWTTIVGGDLEHVTHARRGAHDHAVSVGRSATAYLRRDIEDRLAEQQRQQTELEALSARKRETEPESELPEAPAGRVLVCPAVETKSNTKLRDAVRGHEHAIGVTLPLAPMPDIAVVRRDLVASFPHAVAAIDTLLAPLVGRETVFVPPVILVGPPGAGKTYLVRRLAEALGVGLWRTSAASADGSAFGGTDRRWHSAEACHPFLAISRTRIANPLILVDEVDKASTRADYGRLWDCMLGFLERETAARHPDPCLQVDLDLSHVGYVATANHLTPIPSPLLDRFRVVEMPEPRAEDIAALVPALTADHAREQGLDEAWTVPLSAAEFDLLATRWRGGSVRRLRAYVGVVLRARDRAAPRH